MLRDAFSFARSLVFSVPLILLATVAATSIGLLVALLDPRARLLEWCKRAWARFLLAVSFVHLSVRGRENMDRSHTYVLCANHLSYFDPPVLLAALRTPVRFLAKESLFAIPFLGWAMRGEGDIPIARKNPRAAVRSLAQAVERLRRGTTLVVFPEGGRSPDGTLQSFHSGGFRVAIQARAPVVPVAIRGTRAVLRPGSTRIRGGQVMVQIGQPVPTTGLSAEDQGKLADAVRQSIEQMLKEPFKPG